MKILIMAAALTGVSSAGLAASPHSQPASTAKGAAAPEKTYCLQVEGTGSRIGSKVCKTERKWQAEGVVVHGK